MSFFPEIDDIKINDNKNIGIDFEFINGQHIVENNGKLKEATGIESLKNWIRKVVKTQVNAYEVYVRDESKKFGVNIYEKIGQKDRGYWLSEIRREITEQFEANNYIERVERFEVSIVKRKVVVIVAVEVNDGLKIEEVISI